MVTRRRFLAAGATGGLAALAGCAVGRQEGGVSWVCAAGLSGGDTVFSLTPQVSTYGTTEPPVVELLVPVRRPVLSEEGVDRIEVRSGEETRHRIPVDPNNDQAVGAVQRYDTDDVIEYAQSLGHAPQNGRITLVALDAEDEPVDEIRLDFRCYRNPGQEG